MFIVVNESEKRIFCVNSWYVSGIYKKETFEVPALKVLKILSKSRTKHFSKNIKISFSAYINNFLNGREVLCRLKTLKTDVKVNFIATD